jgi:aromatic-L-amino-acid/L-tryptophan decarboxylase
VNSGIPGDRRDGSPLELDREAMRRMLEPVVEAILERHSSLRDQPAWRGASREALRELVRPDSIESGTPFDELLEHVLRDVLDHAGRIDHPRFMAFVPSSPVWPSILGDILAAGFNVFGGTWLASSGPSTVELEVLSWFKRWIGFGDSAAGLLTSGGSAANMLAIACARLTRYGGHEPRAVLYVSGEAHSSVTRAAAMLGFHRDRVRHVPTDDGLRMRADALEDMADADRAAGLEPFMLIANAGSTNTGAIDPLVSLRAVADAYGMWLHADAAYGGFAVLAEDGRAALRGLDAADSVTLDPHKWLFQTFEAGCLLVRDGHRLGDAFHVMPDYLQDTAVTRQRHADDGEVNFADRGLQLTRATRALKIYLSVRYFGVDAFRAEIARTLELARHAERVILETPSLELLSPAQLGIVCFRNVGGVPSEAERDAHNRALVQRLLDSGAGMISSTRVRGRYALRLCIMNHRTRREDVDALLAELARTD